MTTPLDSLPPSGMDRLWIGRIVRLVAIASVLLSAFAAQAQVTYPLNANGSMGLGSPNGDFTIVQDDMRVKVPGGFVRINRDYDGHQWVFNRQWSGLGNPSYYKSSYLSLTSYMSCDVIDGISSCGNGSAVAADAAPDNEVLGTRITNDPTFGRDANGQPVPGPSSALALARKGVGFTRSTDGTSYVSSKYPRFVVRPQQVPTLPASAGPDAHPSTGKPGQGGVATVMVDGFRWTDRSGEWIEYDNFGRISSYGDRNNVRVWFQYGGHGQVERILDDNGRTVFTLLYKDNAGQFITEARDHTPVDGSIRRVQYHYDGDGRLRRVTDVRGYDTLFDYGNGGAGGLGTTVKVVKVTDAEGRATNISYGITGRIEKLTAPDGGVIEFEYGYDKLKKEFSVSTKRAQTAAGRSFELMRFDQEGRLVTYEVGGKQVLSMQGSWRNATMTDARASSTQVKRDSFDQVTERTSADGSSHRFTYAAGSLDVTEVVDEKGTKAKFGYDSRGNAESVDVAAGLPEAQRLEFEYSSRGEPESLVRKGGLRPDGVTDPDAGVALEYDEAGNVDQLTDGEGFVWHYAYNNIGQITEITDPNSNVTRFTYDAAGNVLTTVDANGNTSSYTYDKTDRPLEVTDPRGKKSSLSYDAAGRLQRLVDPYGAAVQMQYNAMGQMVAANDAVGQQARIDYDTYGRMRKLIDGEGNEVSLDYSDSDGVDRGNGLITKVMYPTLTRLLKHNARGWLTERSASSADGVRTEKFEYDERGLATRSTNAKEKSKTLEHDALGRPTVQKNELGGITKLEYDHRGNVIAITDQRGNRSTMKYDRRDKLVEEANALGQITKYEYDPAGRMTRVLRPSSASVTLAYDDGGRVTSRTAKRSNGATESEVTFVWDPSSNLTEWHTPEASATLNYDDNDSLLSETVTQQGVSLTRTYTYYPNRQVKTYTGPDGRTIGYAYNGNGQLQRMDLPGAGSITIASRQWLAPTEVVFPGGTRLSITRNEFSQPTAVRAVSPGQSTILSQEYTRGLLGEVAERQIGSQTTEYTYDDALRLTVADHSGIPEESFTLDAAGNRTADEDAPATWEYDAANRLKRRGSISYEYDADGNLIAKTDASLSGARRITKYLYDVYNRLAEVRDADDQTISRYTYDPFSYRLSKEITAHGSQLTGTVAGTTLFLQSGDGVLAEADQSGTILRSYGWFVGDQYAKTPVYTYQGGAYYYYLNDSQGVPWRVIDSTGAVVWSALSYRSFGEASIAAGASIHQPWRLPGQYADVETGLYYNLHRYYDPQVGRYTTVDPIGLAGGINAYLYANASPTIYSDAYGLWAGVDDAVAIIGGALVGVVVQGAIDLYNGEASGWESYAAAAVNGAVAGEVLLYTGNPWLAGAAGGLAGNLTRQGLRMLNDKQDHFDVCSMLLETAAGGLGGKFGDLLGKGLSSLAGRLGGKAGSAMAGGADDAARFAANATDDAAKDLPTKVIGRRWDTEVAEGWADHDVLNIPGWTMTKNMEWVDAGIANRQPFYLASPLEGNMIQTTGPFAGQPTVTALEIERLLNAGYTRVGDYYLPPPL